MATITITVTDQEGGTITASTRFEPAVQFDGTFESLTPAQQAAFAALAALKETGLAISPPRALGPEDLQ